MNKVFIIILLCYSSFSYAFSQAKLLFGHHKDSARTGRKIHFNTFLLFHYQPALPKAD